jgi:hypothetical protein
VKKALIWVLTAALLVTPVAYAVAHWGDVTFRDAAVANWLGTIIGVAVGVPIALGIAGYQQRSQAKAETARAAAVIREQLQSARGRVAEELRYNAGTVDALLEALDRSPEVRLEQLQWAKTIADSLVFDARRDFEAIPLDPAQRAHDAVVAIAYRDLHRLVNQVYRTLAAHPFRVAYDGGVPKANWDFKELRAFVAAVRSTVDLGVANLEKPFPSA